MDISEEVIEQFFNKSCTQEEANTVAAYLLDNPHVLDSFIKDEEWGQPAHTLLTAQESRDMLQAVTAKTVSPYARVRWIKRVSAAAAVVAFMAGGWWLWQHNKERPLAKNEGSRKWEQRKNIYNKIMVVHLEDSSVARLLPGAAIRFERLDGKTVKEVYMDGEVDFQVYANRLRTFTVYADNVATTVLGTEFSVKEDSVQIVVALQSGKVVVKPITPTPHWQQPVYLQPGQQLVFNKHAQDVVLSGGSSNVVKARKHGTESATIELNPVKTSSKEIYFQNEELPQVFNQLEQQYKVNIEYNNADVSNVYFIGRFDKTDSIEAILNCIALLKKLQIQHQGDTYIITRKEG
ncbi:FecR family protein [Filimonas lacunae]|uniref:FecR family protein n=1 Tax=Filimonas lacunae TaxID=477680 RepID=A0A173MA20_9BACT|nr:FecR family protein [Filimonas lacunae]BAV04361.1 anti-sigma factor [Filimonas lacunae]SIT31140.1 FecR family protein [Filimonas lacunae]